MIEYELRKQLQSKMEKEYSNYIKELKKEEVEVVVNKSYETVIKEEILSMFYPDNKEFSKEEIKALYKIEKPLETLYQEWMSYDAGINDILKDCISESVSLIEAEHNKSKKELER